MAEMSKRNWLAEARLAADLSQKKVAETLNISQSLYALVESGKRNPSVAKAKAIAELLGFDWTLFYA